MWTGRAAVLSMIEMPECVPESFHISPDFYDSFKTRGGLGRQFSG